VLIHADEARDYYRAREKRLFMEHFCGRRPAAGYHMRIANAAAPEGIIS
jgi:hypothetical protein